MKTTTALLPIFLLLITLPATAQVEHQILDPESGSGISMFGSTVALSGSRALIGAGLFGGSYLFEPQENSAWAEVASLEGGAGPYSRSVALDGDRALTGATAYFAGPGSPATGGAYIYDRQEDGTWVKTATLTADDGAQDDVAGLSVSLDGDRALVGAPGHNDDAGAAYVFERQADASWSQVAKLTPDDAEKRRQIGWFASLDGDRALVGCQGVLEAAEYIDNCVAYVFERQANGSWIQAAKLVSPDAAEEDQNALAASIDGGLAVVGMGMFLPSGSHATRAYVFERQADGTWVQTAHLAAEGGVPATLAGGSVDLDGDRVLLGAPAGILGGAAYLFERQANGSWEQKAEITTAESINQMYGWSVALDGDMALVGTFATNQRAAYVYTGMTATPTEQELELPQTAVLRAGYPNPFNPRLTIPFAVPASQNVRIQVYDVLGREVATLVDGMRPAGEQAVTWEAAGLPSGPYLVRLTAGATTQSRIVVLQK